MANDSTTEVTRAPIMRSVLLSAAILLGLLAGAEAALRTDYVFDRLPMPRPYYTPDVTRRLHYLAQLERKHCTIDVLFVGSSAVRAGFQPKVFDRALRFAGAERMVSFNGGFSKMYPAGARLYLDHVWLEQTTPRFVLHGIRPNELLGVQTASSYLGHGMIESLWLERTTLAMLEAQLIGASKLLQYRGTLINSLKRWSKGRPLHYARERGEMATDENGYRKENSELAYLLKHRNKRLWRYDEKPRADAMQRGLKVLDGMRQSCERAGVQYVLVHLPEHPKRFGAANGPVVWQAYQEGVQAWAREHHVPFIDITHGDYNRFSDVKHYADYHHLSPRGAKALSELVAKEFAALLAQRGQLQKRD
jgi:hypothetical protein